MAREKLLVCKRCLLAIESREGIQATLQHHVEDCVNSECDWCGQDGHDILYELVAVGGLSNNRDRLARRTPMDDVFDRVKGKLVYAEDILDLFYVASAGQDKRFVDIVEDVIENTPEIDAVKVVRCKDCKHGRPIDNTKSPEKYFKDECIVCEIGDEPMIYSPTHFCACGERDE